MKKFTPPPMSDGNSSESGDESEEESDKSEQMSNVDDNIIRASDKTEDEYLKLVRTTIYYIWYYLLTINYKHLM